MKNDLKTIKKLYGEDFMHFCRHAFPTILDEKNALPNLLTTYFDPQKNLYNDLITYELDYEFKQFIYKKYYKNEEIKDTDKTPQELLLEKDYILYECKSEKDIQRFKSYYTPQEEICTFEGGRLNKCHVFFAVKKNASELDRANFTSPKRQDEYGTSVISIQFSRDESHILSIKNRYNHTVENCDATYGNNLDNIIEGLTMSFEKTYNLKQEFIQSEFTIPGYVRANDGRLYKYNHAILNNYYCPNNVIIYNGDPIKYDKEKYIVVDYFLLKLGQKPSITKVDNIINDKFCEDLDDIKKVKVVKHDDYKEVTVIRNNCEDVIIKLDNLNRIIGYKNNNLRYLRSFLLEENKVLQELDTPNVESIRDYVLFNNQDMKILNLPKLESIGMHFMFSNKPLHTIYAPKLKYINRGSFWWNNDLTNFVADPDVAFDYGVFNNHLKSIGKER